jgi:hypothetical protein
MRYRTAQSHGIYTWPTAPVSYIFTREMRCSNPGQNTDYTYLLTPWCRVLLEKLTSFAANQGIPCILWNPKIHYRTHKRPPPVHRLYCLRDILAISQPLQRKSGITLRLGYDRFLPNPFHFIFLSLSSGYVLHFR